MSEGWRVTYGGPRPYPKVEVEKALKAAVERAPDIASAFHHGWAVAASPDHSRERSAGYLDEERASVT